jgi:GNAT superfamily N-acetyltransferase
MVLVRPMTQADIHVARGLLAQLGYPMDVVEVRRRYDAVAWSDDHTLIVGEQDGQIVALCHAYARPALDKPPEAVVQALVVDQAVRGRGAAKIMMEAAEAWAAERGFTSVALASHVSRAGAHVFYEAIGYQREATSHLFRKLLK